MLINYLLIAFRNLRKHFAYSVINIAGLGLGIATCLLLVALIRHELSYDRFHIHADRIYRASLEYSLGGLINRISLSPTALLPVLQKNFAEIENGVRVYNPTAFNPFVVRQNENLFQENKFYYADSTFFSIFSYRLLKGQPARALVSPNSVVLTESMAKKYFGDEDPMGKTLEINNATLYTVTGLMENAPSNSLLQFEFVASFSSLDAAKEQIWWSANYETYLLLSPLADPETLQSKTNELIKKELASGAETSGDYVRYNFLPLTDIYLRSDMNESEVVSNIRYIYGLGGISIVILLIACINYINLATAKAVDRAREVGIRKVVGALRKQLFAQFIGESMMITLLSFLLAFLLAYGSLPLFNAMTGRHFGGSIFLEGDFMVLCLVAWLAIAVIAGAYPAMAITAFKPVSVLKGNFRNSGRGIWLRKSLVVFQFCITIILMVGTLVIIQQLDYLRNKRLGYEKENVVVLPLDAKGRSMYGQLRTELLRTGKVTEVGRATESPTKIRGGYSIHREGNGDAPGMATTAMATDSSFISTLGMELSAGRNFNTADFHRASSDSITSFILNESAVRLLFLDAAQAIGARVNLNGRKGPIVGVVKDFHFAPLHSAIGPLVLFNEESQYRFMFVRLSAGNISAALEKMKEVSVHYLPHRPFEYEFLDTKYASLYDSEQRMGTIGSVFASLAIIIACLGLFGLVAFSASQKTKEIGIRKVMGATATGIVVLITKDYARLVVLAIAIGIPLSHWAINTWFLGNFAYRVHPGFWPFASAALACLIIAFGTASYQAVKSAFLSPAEALRSE